MREKVYCYDYVIGGIMAKIVLMYDILWIYSLSNLGRDYKVP